MSRANEPGSTDRALPKGNRIPRSELQELASRASGPGGQHVNTSSTRVSLRWNVRESKGLTEEARGRLLARLKPRLTREGVLIVHADRHRSRVRNQEDALDRLEELVRTALYQAPPRKSTKPSQGAKRRRLEGKRKRSQLKSQRSGLGDHGD